MIVGFDFHGVSQKYPEVFKPLMQLLRSVGAEVWIVSGPPMKQMLTEITQAGYFAGVHFDNIISVVDYLKSQGVNMWKNENDSWEADASEWWQSKSKICNLYGIDLLIDDSPKYAEYFETNCPDAKFIHLKDCNFKHMLCGIVDLMNIGLCEKGEY